MARKMEVGVGALGVDWREFYFSAFIHSETAARGRVWPTFKAALPFPLGISKNVLTDTPGDLWPWLP